MIGKRNYLYTLRSVSLDGELYLLKASDFLSSIKFHNNKYLDDYCAAADQMLIDKLAGAIGYLFKGNK